MSRSQQRAELRRQYGALFDQVSAVLFTADPIGINLESNTDEYDPEVDTILPRLRACGSIEDVQTVVHQEFLRWFSPGSAGPVERYANIAAQIWQLWQQFIASQRPT